MRGAQPGGRLTFDALGQEQRWVYGAAGRLEAHRVYETPGSASPSYEHRYHYDEPAAGTPLTDSAHANLWGQLSWLEFPTGEEHFAFDTLGRSTEQVTRLWNPEKSNFDTQTRDEFHRKLTYRADGQVTQVQAPGGLTLRSAYNLRGGLQSLTAQLGSDTPRAIASEIAYDHRGAETMTLAGNGVSTWKRFNERAELTAFLAGKGVTATDLGTTNRGFHHVTYDRGHDALINGITDNSDWNSGLERLDAAYTYDAIHQLTRVEEFRGSASENATLDDPAVTEFHYDEIQNLVRRDILNDVKDRPTGDFLYGEGTAGPNAITKADGQEFWYDAAGQMLQYNGYDLLWDGEGRLVQAQNGTTGRTLINHYDDAGELRIALLYTSKTEDAPAAAKVHRFVAPDYQVRDGEERWFSGAGSVGVEVTKTPGLLIDNFLLVQLTAYVAGTETKPKPLPEEYLDLARDGGGFSASDLELAREALKAETRVGGERTVWRYSTSDHLGGMTHVTDSVGELVSSQRFHAYGKAWGRRGVAPSRGYIGKDREVDEELGLLRLGARWYAPALGRFVTADPLIGQSPADMVDRLVESNLYSYSANNPIMGKDPTGLECSGPNQNESCGPAGTVAAPINGATPGSANASLTDADYAAVAKRLGVETATLKAVAQVEGGRSGFLQDGTVKVLFERHYFHRLTKGQHDTSSPDVSNKKPGGYKGGSQEWQRLEKAAGLDFEAALKSASWGRFQIMGANFKAAGFKSVDEFVSAMQSGEIAQLEALASFLVSKGLDKKLQQKDWAGFASGYNGKDYAKNQYDTKLSSAYNAAKLAEARPSAQPQQQPSAGAGGQR